MSGPTGDEIRAVRWSIRCWRVALATRQDRDAPVPERSCFICQSAGAERKFFDAAAGGSPSPRSRASAALVVFTLRQVSALHPVCGVEDSQSMSDGPFDASASVSADFSSSVVLT